MAETPHSAPGAGHAFGALNSPTHSNPTTAPPAVATDFHKAFPQVPLTENVVQDFQCSLSRKKLLRVGRLYVTPLRLCFNSMLVEPVEILWTDVESCEKKSQMLFDQIIVVPCDKTRYGGELCFTGFMNGCSSPFSTVRMLWSVRKKYSKQAAKPQASLEGLNSDERAVVQIPPIPTVVKEQPSAIAPAANGVQPALAGKVITAANPVDSASGGTLDGLPRAGESVSPNSISVTRASPPPDGATTELRNASMSMSLPSPRTDPSADGLQRSVRRTASIDRLDDASPPHVHFAPRTTPPGPTAVETTPPPNAQSPPAPQAKSSPVTGRTSPPITPRDATPAAGQQPSDVSPTTSRPQTPQRDANAPARSESPTPQKAINKHSRTRSEGGVDPAQLQAQNASHADLLKSFPAVPRTESILDSFQCSYVSGVHRVGKMHITGNYILFYSVMMTEPIVAKLIDVASIEKAKNLLFLDGLAITMRDGTRHEFTSFLSREKAYGMLTQLIETHNTISRSLGATVSAGARPASPGRTREAAAQPSDVSPEVSASPTNMSNGSPSPTASGGAPNSPPTAPAAAPSPAKALTKKRTFGTALVDDSAALVPAKELADFDTLVPTDYGTVFSKPSLFMETPVTDESSFLPGYDIFDVFKALHDEKAPVLAQYRQYRRDKEVVFDPWRPPKKPDAQQPPMSGQRVMHCDMIIRALITEKYYPYEEFQRFALLNINGQRTLIYQTSGQASGVTFSDTFRAESLCVYYDAVDDATGLPIVRVRHYMYIQFLKFSIVKGKIRSETLKELKEGMNRQNNMVIEHLRSAPSSSAFAKAVAESAAKSTAPAPTGIAGTPRSTTVSAAPGPTFAAAAAAASAGAAPAAVPVVVTGPHPFALPKSGPQRIAVLVMVGFAVLYLVYGLWNTFWFSVASVPGGTIEGATVDASSLQLAIAADSIANFFAYVLRPFFLTLMLLAGSGITCWVSASVVQ